MYCSLPRCVAGVSDGRDGEAGAAKWRCLSTSAPNCLESTWQRLADLADGDSNTFVLAYGLRLRCPSAELTYPY